MMTLPPEPGIIAASLGAHLPPALLHHEDPTIRAHAAGCVPATAEATAVLLDLLTDLNADVANAAACALAHLGRPEAQAALLHTLRINPTAEAIDAIAAIPDETGITLPGRIARTIPALAPAATRALREIEDPRAAAILDRLAT